MKHCHFSQGPVSQQPDAQVWPQEENGRNKIAHHFFQYAILPAADSRSDLEVFDFSSYGYEEAITELVDQFLLLAVRTPPANANKFKKRQGAKATKKLERLESIGEILNSHEATLFRALAARCNYLASDRADIAYSAKELCREFAVPNVRSYAKLKR